MHSIGFLKAQLNSTVRGYSQWACLLQTEYECDCSGVPRSTGLV